jgi:hypothetical protein
LANQTTQVKPRKSNHYPGADFDVRTFKNGFHRHRELVATRAAKITAFANRVFAPGLWRQL